MLYNKYLKAQNFAMPLTKWQCLLYIVSFISQTFNCCTWRTCSASSEAWFWGHFNFITASTRSARSLKLSVQRLQRMRKWRSSFMVYWSRSWRLKLSDRSRKQKAQTFADRNRWEHFEQWTLWQCEHFCNNTTTFPMCNVIKRNTNI